MKGLRSDDGSGKVAPWHLFFSVYLEPFCLSIINSHNVRGYKLYSSEVKILAYADDVAVICEDKQSISAVVQKSKMFGKHTGSLINGANALDFGMATGRARNKRLKTSNEPPRLPNTLAFRYICTGTQIVIGLGKSNASAKRQRSGVDASCPCSPELLCAMCSWLPR